MTELTRRIGNSTVARRFIPATEPLGSGNQTAAVTEMVGITEGYRRASSSTPSPIASRKTGNIIPIIARDFIMHWRDVEEAHLTGQPLSFAKSAAAAAACARAEDRFVLYGDESLGYEGLMTTAGRRSISGLTWDEPGAAFANFSMMTREIATRGFAGPFASVVHPRIYANMHRVLEGSSLLEIAHVRALLQAGIFRSPELGRNSGLVMSAGRQIAELAVSIDVSVAFLGSRQMNLPFRVFKAVYLRLQCGEAIFTFSP